MKYWERFAVEGLNCVVTGAASGIGLAYAEVMAEAGAQVTLLDLDAKRLQEQVARLNALGFAVHGEVVDATDRQAMYACFERIGERYGRLDVVFANAGIDAGPGFLDSEGQRCAEGALEALDEAHWDKVLATNLTAVFTTLRAAVRLMKPRGQGRIIVTTSNAAIINEAIVGTPYMPAKAGAASLVRQAAMEPGPLWHQRQRHRARPVRDQHRRGPLAQPGGPCSVRPTGAATPDCLHRRNQRPGLVSGLAGLGLRHRRADRHRWRADARPGGLRRR